MSSSTGVHYNRSVLAKLYIVNCSDTKRYIRGISANAKVSDVPTKLTFVDHFMWDARRSHEYGWSDDPGSYFPRSLEPLLPTGPSLALAPEEPICGWVHFKLGSDPRAAGFNLSDALDAETITLWIIDSVGKKYRITKTADHPPKGKMSLRRVT